MFGGRQNVCSFISLHLPLLPLCFAVSCRKRNSLKDSSIIISTDRHKFPPEEDEKKACSLSNHLRHPQSSLFVVKSSKSKASLENFNECRWRNLQENSFRWLLCLDLENWFHCSVHLSVSSCLLLVYCWLSCFAIFRCCRLSFLEMPPNRHDVFVFMKEVKKTGLKARKKENENSLEPE